MSYKIKYEVVINNFRIIDIDNHIVNNGEIAYCNKAEASDMNPQIEVLLQQKDSEENIFTIEVTCKKDLDKADLMDVGKRTIDSLLNLIAFYCSNAKVGDPSIVDLDYKDKKMSTKKIPGLIFVSNKERDKKELGDLCNKLIEENNFHRDDYNFFRAAMNNEDIVVKYMFLYQILLIKHKKDNGEESQNKVDSFIKLKYSQENHEYQLWSDTNREETIYTRLRNQVGHLRGKTPQETRSEMEKSIDKLVELVKLSILENE